MGSSEDCLPEDIADSQELRLVSMVVEIIHEAFITVLVVVNDSNSNSVIKRGIVIGIVKLIIIVSRTKFW